MALSDGRKPIGAPSALDDLDFQSLTYDLTERKASSDDKEIKEKY
jgi:hypothetical protein